MLRCVALVLLALPLPSPLAAQVELLSTSGTTHSFKQLAQEVSQRTSVSLAPRLRIVKDFRHHAWVWMDAAQLTAVHKISQWLKKGGMLIVNGDPPTPITAKTFPATLGKWQHVPLDSALMRSFYLLNSLPTCQNKSWQVYMFHERLTIVAMPYPLLAFLRDQPSSKHPCFTTQDRETHVRVFINLLMVALATDYKKDQVHLPEILKRLR
ncbi:MAG: hypothetical protein OYH77_03175 [Pseudomonadota bacterium]|nr:hypothetical protein [Pseudomonadota bacterium]